jgi:hypothetical protein
LFDNPLHYYTIHPSSKLTRHQEGYGNCFLINSNLGVMINSQDQ